MDVEILGSSDHDDGEQDQLVDKAIQNQEGTPKVTDTATADEKMESSPEVANDAAKVADNVVAKVGNENPNLHEIPVEPMITDDKDVTLSESNEVKETADREAALALSGGHLGKSPQEMARLAHVALDQMEDLDQYLDIFMADQTMTVAKAVKVR